MKRFIFILILLCGHAKAMAALSMQITPSPARLGDTLQLTLTLNEMSDVPPDLSPLEKDFTLAGTEHNMSYTAANGVTKSESQWIVFLIAKKAGVLSIPSIQIGHQYSAHGQVTITTSSMRTTLDNQTDSLEDDAVLLQAETSKSNPFIREQVIYTVKLFSRKPLMNAEYHPPRVEDALLISLGDGRRYQTTLNGQEYGVDEQLYAVYPQKSGELKITPPEFNAIVYDAVPRRIHVDGSAVKLIVKQVPERNAREHWLPAIRVTLTEQYDTLVSTIGLGNTIVRTVTLQSVAMPAELLPALEFTDNKQFSTYLGKPESHNTLRHKELIGTTTVNVTYLLNQTGAVTLPSISLPWFNTVTGKQERATLPERTLTVTGKASAPITPSATQEPPHQVIPTPQPTLAAPATQSHQIAWWLAGALVMVGLVTLMLSRYRHKTGVIKQNIRSVLLQLRKVCSMNDPVQAHAALLNWGRMQWPDMTLFNLGQLKNLVYDIELKKQTLLLSQALYSQNSQANWHGDALWHAVKHYQPRKSTLKTKRNTLPPINPDSFSD